MTLLSMLHARLLFTAPRCRQHMRSKTRLVADALHLNESLTVEQPRPSKTASKRQGEPHSRLMRGMRVFGQTSLK